MVLLTKYVSLAFVLNKCLLLLINFVFRFAFVFPCWKVTILFVLKLFRSSSLILSIFVLLFWGLFDFSVGCWAWFVQFPLCLLMLLIDVDSWTRWSRLLCLFTEIPSVTVSQGSDLRVTLVGNINFSYPVVWLLSALISVLLIVVFIVTYSLELLRLLSYYWTIMYKLFSEKVLCECRDDSCCCQGRCCLTLDFRLVVV